MVRPGFVLEPTTGVVRLRTIFVAALFIQRQQRIELTRVTRRGDRAVKRNRLARLQLTNPATLDIFRPTFNASRHRLNGTGVGAAGPPVLPIAQPWELLAVVLDFHAEAALAVDDASQHIALRIAFGIDITEHLAEASMNLQWRGSRAIIFAFEPFDAIAPRHQVATIAIDTRTGL